MPDIGTVHKETSQQIFMTSKYTYKSVLLREKTTSCIFIYIFITVGSTSGQYDDLL